MNAQNVQPHSLEQLPQILSDLARALKRGNARYRSGGLSVVWRRGTIGIPSTNLGLVEWAPRSPGTVTLTADITFETGLKPVRTRQSTKPRRAKPSTRQSASSTKPSNGSTRQST